MVGSLGVVELHQSHDLDSGVVVALEQVSVSVDHGAVEDVIVAVVLVQDVPDVVDGVGLAGRRLMNIGPGGVQVLKPMMLMGFLTTSLRSNQVLKVHFASFITEGHSDASKATVSRVADIGTSAINLIADVVVGLGVPDIPLVFDSGVDVLNVLCVRGEVIGFVVGSLGIVSSHLSLNLV